MKSINYLKNISQSQMLSVPNKQKKNVKFKKINGFYVIDSKIKSESDKIYIDSIVRNARISMINLYLKNIPVIEISKDEFESNRKISYLATRSELEKRCLKLYDGVKTLSGKINMNNNFVVKILYESNIIYLSIDENELIDSYSIFMMMIDPVDKISTIIFISVPHIFNKDDVNSVIHNVSIVHGTPLYISSKDRFIDNHFKSLDTSILDVDGIDSLIMMQILEYSINKINQELNLNKLEEKPFHHTQYEMNIYRRLYSDSKLVEMFNIKCWRSTNCIDENEEFIMESYNKEINNNTLDFVIKPDESCPLVDFSEKEMKFINKYTDESSLFMEEPKRKIDMVKVFENPRYGKLLKIKSTPTELHPSYIIYFTYIYEGEKDKCNLFIHFDISDNIVGYIRVIFRNIKNFRFSESIFGFNTSIIFRDNIELPQSAEEFNNKLPVILTDRNTILNLIADIVSIYAIIHERPQRSRVIRETTRTSIQKSYNSRSNETEQFIIRRILKDSKSAKEYVKSMTGSSPDRVYTLEEWERVGYYRRKPNSEEKIWIEPTTCHRRLGLSDKEVHIKL